MNMWNKSLDPIQQAQIDFVVSQQHKTKKKRNTMNNQHRSLLEPAEKKTPYVFMYFSRCVNVYGNFFTNQPYCAGTKAHYGNTITSDNKQTTKRSERKKNRNVQR